MATYGIFAGVLGVLALLAVVGCLIWAGVAMNGKGRGLVMGGLGLMLLSRLAMGLAQFLVAQIGVQGMMMSQAILGFLGTVGIVLVVAGAVQAGKGTQQQLPRPTGQQLPNGQQLPTHPGQQPQPGQWQNPYGPRP